MEPALTIYVHKRTVLYAGGQPNRLVSGLLILMTNRLTMSLEFVINTEHPDFSQYVQLVRTKDYF